MSTVWSGAGSHVTLENARCSRNGLVKLPWYCAEARDVVGRSGCRWSPGSGAVLVVALVGREPNSMFLTIGPLARPPY